MSRKTKPRNNDIKVTSKHEYPIVDVDDVKKLPPFYMAVNSANIENLDKIREKLYARGIRVVEPIKIVRMTRMVKSVELYIAIEKVANV